MAHRSSTRDRLIDRVRQPAAWLFIIALVALIAAIGLTVVGRVELASTVLAAVVLLVTAMTYRAVVPERGRLLVVRQDELELSDLIFSVSGGHEGRAIPRDYLLQLHVAVCNVGGRKVVLSNLRLVALLDPSGTPIQIPEMPGRLRAEQYVQIIRRRIETGMRVEPYSETLAGPWLLGPDDVITLRFRCRRGIDWSARWDLPSVQRLARALDREIAGARLEMTYRQGRTVVSETVEVSCKVEQQAKYRKLLTELTAGFTSMPTGLDQEIAIE